MKDLAQYSKAFVPMVVMGCLSLLALVGITGEMTVEDALTLAATSALVWLVPNKKV
jgi:hypothetical protein